MNYRALALGAAIGFVFAMSPSCSPPKTCNATNCAGCCDSTGTCQQPSATACGASGNTCVACAANQTCNLGTCGTGGGTGGAGGGGGGASCASQGLCDKPSGGCGTDPCGSGCCIAGDAFGRCNTSPNQQLCGKNAAVCVACGAGQTCTAVTGGSECTGGAGGGSGGGGGTTVDAGVVGNECTTNSDCGAGHFCKTNTGTKTDGGASLLPDGGAVTGVAYPAGYCTRPCTATTAAQTAAQCGVGNSCANFAPETLGESERLCVKGCSVELQNCRADYTCMGFSSTGVCFMDPDLPSGITGNACTNDYQCGNSLSQFCEGGPASNFPELPDGFCTATCEPAAIQQRAQTYCGADSVCMDFGGSSTQGDFLNLCNKLCALPDAGDVRGQQANCRAGHVCGAVFADSNMNQILNSGICTPDCNNAPASACSAGYPACVDAGTPFYGQCCKSVDGGAGGDPIQNTNDCYNPIILYLSGLP